MVLFPAIEVVSRLFGTTGIVASPVLVQHLTLYIGFSGAIIASRRNKLLSLSNSLLFNNDNQIVWAKIIAKVTTIVVVTVLALGAWNLVMIEKEFPTDIAPFIPRWVALLIMPIGFASIAFHMIYNSYSESKNRRAKPPRPINIGAPLNKENRIAAINMYGKRFISLKTSH